MKLYEYEGKMLLDKAGIAIPFGRVLKSPDAPVVRTTFSELSQFIDAFAVKAQVLAGSRGKAGGILFANTQQELQDAVAKLLGSELKGEAVEEVLVERKLSIQDEYYVGIMFDTKIRAPVLILSKHGGIDIEETKKKNPEQVITEPIDYLSAKQYGLDPIQLSTLFMKAGFDASLHEHLTLLINKLFLCFLQNDLKLIEINPLVRTTKQSLTTPVELVAADCVAIMDDNAMYRQTAWKFPQRIGVRKQPTPLEQQARSIDENDHRGVAGKTFIEFDGDIAVLASGGGCSITAMDALLSYGTKPANYTEYSGNPPIEKVEKLTKITLSKPGLCGCWVVGGVANFTDIKETLQGFMNAVIDIKPDYPILIRRGGPNDKEAFVMIKELAKKHKLDITCYDETMPVSESGKILVEKVNLYKKKKGLVK